MRIMVMTMLVIMVVLPLLPYPHHRCKRYSTASSPLPTHPPPFPVFRSARHCRTDLSCGGSIVLQPCKSMQRKHG